MIGKRHRFIQWCLLANLVLLAVALWQRNNLPPPNQLSPLLLNEPVQTAIHQAPFTTTKGGITYTVSPLFEYELVGLVVSKHDTHTWWDYAHREWNDELNVADLCVVWGNNVRNGSYQEVHFSSGQFTCNFSTTSDEVFAAFDQTAISNNHLLTDDPYIAKTLAKVQVGDQIMFHGRLAEYAHNHGFAFHRGTSTVRTDTGNGACETVFLDSVSILSSSNSWWRRLVWLHGLLIIASVIAWFVVPMQMRD